MSASQHEKIFLVRCYFFAYAWYGCRSIIHSFDADRRMPLLASSVTFGCCFQMSVKNAGRVVSLPSKVCGVHLPYFFNLRSLSIAPRNSLHVTPHIPKAFHFTVRFSFSYSIQIA